MKPSRPEHDHRSERSGANLGSDAELDAVFDRLVAALAAQPRRHRVVMAGRYIRRLEALRLATAAEASRGNKKKAKGALNDPGRSRQEVNRDARRAATLGANEALAEHLESGDIAPETIDSLSKAADETGHIPDELINQVTGISPDETKRAVSEFIQNQADADAVNAAHDRAMEARRIRRYEFTTPEGVGLAGLAVEGPAAIIDRIFNQINADADAAYQAAGGRDVPRTDHEPWAHRQFDAAVAYFTGGSGGPGSPDASGGARRPGSRARPSVVVNIQVDKNGPGVPHQAGTGPIGADAFADYASEGDVSVILADLDGSPLWLGRAQRRASVAQYLALVVRDRGCVLCGAHVLRCDAHHILPWEAPAKGTTDITNLALVCRPCHTDLHARRLTLERHTQTRPGHRPTVTWKTRPAKAHETPPPRPPQRSPRPVQRE